MSVKHLEEIVVKNLLDLLSRVQKHECVNQGDWSKKEIHQFIDILSSDNKNVVTVEKDDVLQVKKENVDSNLFEELIDIQMMQKSLIPSIPKELMENLPSELFANLQIETETNLISLAQKESCQEKVIQSPIKDKSEQESIETNNDCLKEILDLAGELNENQAETVFLQLQSMINEAEENVKYKKLKNLKEEVVLIRADHVNDSRKDTNEEPKVHSIQEEPKINSTDVTIEFNEKEKLEESDGVKNDKWENVSTDVIVDLLEMQVTQEQLMPELPEQLINNLPQELLDMFQQDLQSSLRMMAHQ